VRACRIAVATDALQRARSNSPTDSSVPFLLAGGDRGLRRDHGGLVLSSYFIGFTLGATRCGRIIERIAHRDARTGLWSSTAEVAYYVANSPTSARHAATQSDATGTSRTACTTPAMSRSRRISPVSVTPRLLRQAALLRLQHPASQSDFNLQSRSLRRRSRRSQRTPQVELQLRALSSPGLQWRVKVGCRSWRSQMQRTPNGDTDSPRLRSSSRIPCKSQKPCLAIGLAAETGCDQLSGVISN
jgi:hypothetical protein